MTERVILSGREELLKLQITQIMAFYQLMENRDVGMIVGQPEEEWRYKQPRERHLSILFRSKEKPPWRLANGKNPKQVTVTIPDAKKGLSWGQIKTAASPYIWGKFRAQARLDNGRMMCLYGSTSPGAVKKLKQILELSASDYVSIEVQEEVERNSKIVKHPTQVFPCSATILVRSDSLWSKGKVDISGKSWKEEPVKFDLWTDKQPFDIGTLK